MVGRQPLRSPRLIPQLASSLLSETRMVDEARRAPPELRLLTWSRHGRGVRSAEQEAQPI